VVRVLVARDGVLRSFEAAGHAGAEPRGANVACAAATALLRTAARLGAARGLVTGGSAGERGALSCDVARPRAGDHAWLRGATDFLLRGLADIAAEVPGAVELDVVTTEE
jgi:uncharacterized protein